MKIKDLEWLVFDENLVFDSTLNTKIKFNYQFSVDKYPFIFWL